MGRGLGYHSAGNPHHGGRVSQQRAVQPLRVQRRMDTLALQAGLLCQLFRQGLADAVRNRPATYYPRLPDLADLATALVGMEKSPGVAQLQAAFTTRLKPSSATANVGGTLKWRQFIPIPYSTSTLA
jgi:hypothetical protein